MLVELTEDQRRLLIVFVTEKFVRLRSLGDMEVELLETEALLRSLHTARVRWKLITSAPQDRPILVGDYHTGSMRWAVWSNGKWRDGVVDGQICGCPVPTHWTDLPPMTDLEFKFAEIR